MAIGALTGMVTDGIASSRQMNYQQQLNAEQEAAAKRLSEHQNQMAMEMWRNTNYSAQRKEMEKAGLNVGMMYGKGGQGGSTQGVGTPMPNAGGAGLINSVGMGMQTGLQMQMQQAQIKLAESQAKNIDADTKVKEGQPGVQEAGRQKTIAEIGNEVLKGSGIELDNELKRIDRYVKDNTASDSIAMINAALDRARGEAESAGAKGKVDSETVNEAIQIMQQSAIEQQVRIAAGKMGMKVDAQQIQNMSANITKVLGDNQREWEMMTYRDREINIKQKANEIAQQMADFNTGGEAQTARWAQIITQMLGGAKGWPGPGKKK